MTLSRAEFLVASAAGLASAVSGSTSQARGSSDSKTDRVISVGPRLAAEQDDTASLQRAIFLAAASGGGRVEAAPGRIYAVRPAGRILVLNPSGGMPLRNYCLKLPSNVTLDMRGSTLQLQGSTEASILVNSHADNTARDSNIGLLNATLDGRSIKAVSHSLVQLSYIDGLRMNAVTITGSTYIGLWIYACARGQFDRIRAQDCSGQPLQFGDPQTGGSGRNSVYNSTFGAIEAYRISLLDIFNHPGNAFYGVLEGFTIDSITATDCAAGVKIQGPSRDGKIRHVRLNRTGDARTMNSGFKLQATSGRAPQRIAVERVVAANQCGVGLYLEGSVNCSVDTYRGVNNGRLGTHADVWINGTNDSLVDVRSEGAGGPAVEVRRSASNYVVGHARIVNPARANTASARFGILIDGGHGRFSHVSIVDSRKVSTLQHAAAILPGAQGSITSLVVQGLKVPPVSTRARGFKFGSVRRSAL